MEMIPTFIEELRAEYLTEQELAMILNVDTRNLQDRRSRGGFITYYKPSKSCILYHRDDVRAFIMSSKVLDKEAE